MAYPSQGWLHNTRLRLPPAKEAWPRDTEDGFPMSACYKQRKVPSAVFVQPPSVTIKQNLPHAFR